MAGFLDSLSPLVNPNAIANAVAGGQNGPTPTLQQPQGLTPAQLASLREYIGALQKQSIQPIGTVAPKAAPLAALGKGAESLITGLMAGQADRAERERLGSAANALDGGDTSGASASPSSSTSANLSYGAGMIPMDAAKAAIAGNESGGRYGEVGPDVPARGGHPAGHAVGKYQVMNYDLPNRLAAAGLPPMNEAEFLRNPEAQERQFEHEFGNLMKKYGNFNDAASVWFSGRPLAKAGNASDAAPGYAGTTVPAYVAKANATLARLVGGSSDGTDVTGGTRPQGAGLGSPQQVAQTLGGPNYGGSPNYQEMVRSQAAKLLRTGQYGGPNAVHDAIADATALVEGNTKYMPTYSTDPYGREMVNVLGQPARYTGRQLTPGKEGKIKIGDTEIPTVETVGPNGNIISKIVAPGADNNPAAGSIGGSFLEQGPIGDIKHAQNRLAAEKAGMEKTETARAEQYEDRRKTIMKRAQDVRDEIPQLELAKRVISDPNYSSGFLSGEQSKLDQIGQKLGVTSGKMATTYQLAKKLGAAGSLANVRMLGELGAVRVPEMHMVEKSTYDPENLPEVNYAVVDMNLRSAKREAEVAQLARDYLKSHNRLDEGFEQIVADNFKDKPLFSDDEIKSFDSLLDRNREAKEAKAKASAAGAPAPKMRRYNKETGTFEDVK